MNMLITVTICNRYVHVHYYCRNPVSMGKKTETENAISDSNSINGKNTCKSNFAFLERFKVFIFNS